MARTSARTVNTSIGTAAYALALAHEAVLQPRLPAGLIATLATDLVLLGAPPAGTTAPAPVTPAAAAPTPISLADATATVVALVTAIHHSIRGSKASPAVRKLYGASGKATKAPKAVAKEGHKIINQAKTDPSQALSLGILPSDVVALGAALQELEAAETAAGSKGGTSGTTAKQRRAAAVAMNDAVARIAGAGVLAFATNASVRAQFEALLLTRSGTGGAVIVMPAPT